MRQTKTNPDRRFWEQLPGSTRAFHTILRQWVKLKCVSLSLERNLLKKECGPRTRLWNVSVLWERNSDEMECVLERWMTRGVGFRAATGQLWNEHTYGTFWSLASLTVTHSRSVSPCKTPRYTTMVDKWFINALLSHARDFSHIFYWCQLKKKKAVQLQESIRDSYSSVNQKVKIGV